MPHTPLHDETGEHHGARLAGDWLVDNRYAGIPVAEPVADILQVRNEVLNLNLRWEQGYLGLYVPATGRHIATFAGEQAARLRAEAEAREERLARLQAQVRIRELEDVLRQLRYRLRKPGGLTAEAAGNGDTRCPRMLVAAVMS